MNKKLIHPTALCASANIGLDTTIGPYSRISTEVTIGSSCSVGHSVQISGDVSIGNRVILSDEVRLRGPLEIEDDVRIGSGVIIGPESDAGTPASPLTSILAGATIRPNSRIFPGVTLGIQSLVLEGSQVAASVDNYGTIDKNGDSPGRLGTLPLSRLSDSSVTSVSHLDRMSKVSGVKLISFHEAQDSRGNLLALEMSDLLPFEPKRLFTVSSVPRGQKRGIHAHYRCHQFIVPICGEVQVTVADGRNAEEYLLDSPKVGLYMPPLTWGTQHNFSDGSTILVLASERYDRSDYIHHWDDFIQAIESK